MEAKISLPFSRSDNDSGMSLITVRSREPYSPEFLSAMRAAEGVVYARCVNPVYDILPIEEPDMPFTTAKEMFAYAAEKMIPVWQAALDYEQAISGLDTEKLMGFAENLWDLTVHAAEEGYKVTAFDGAIIKPHSAQFKALCEQGRVIPLGVGDMGYRRRLRCQGIRCRSRRHRRYACRAALPVCRFPASIMRSRRWESPRRTA